jgi:hypothetical protein
MSARVWSRELSVMRIPLAVAISITVLGLVVALMAPAAQAQGMGGRGRQHADTPKGTGKATKADEKAYKDALKSIPEKKVDPWGNMR